jgi:predicted transcriptional regulator
MNRNRIEKTGGKRQPESSVRKPESASKMYDDEKENNREENKKAKGEKDE